MCVQREFNHKVFVSSARMREVPLASDVSVALSNTTGGRAKAPACFAPRVKRAWIDSAVTPATQRNAQFRAAPHHTQAFECDRTEICLSYRDHHSLTAREISSHTSVGRSATAILTA
jgi:hypothetical protein